jgi:hypothetical protein
MIIGTHDCAPVLAALTIDVLRLHKVRKQLFPQKHLIAIGLAGCHLTKSHTAPIYARIKVNGFLGMQTCPLFSPLAAFCDPAEIASRAK